SRSEWRVNAFVAVYPSFLQVPKDIQSIAKPGLFLLADNDEVFSESLVESTKRVIQGLDVGKEGKVEFVKYKGTKHGFAARVITQIMASSAPVPPSRIQRDPELVQLLRDLQKGLNEMSHHVSQARPLTTMLVDKMSVALGAAPPSRVGGSIAAEAASIVARSSADGVRPMSYIPPNVIVGLRLVETDEETPAETNSPKTPLSPADSVHLRSRTSSINRAPISQAVSRTSSINRSPAAHASLARPSNMMFPEYPAREEPVAVAPVVPPGVTSLAQSKDELFQESLRSSAGMRPRGTSQVLKNLMLRKGFGGSRGSSDSFGSGGHFKRKEKGAKSRFEDNNIKESQDVHDEEKEQAESGNESEDVEGSGSVNSEYSYDAQQMSRKGSVDSSNSKWSFAGFQGRNLKPHHDSSDSMGPNFQPRRASDADRMPLPRGPAAKGMSTRMQLRPRAMTGNTGTATPLSPLSPLIPKELVAESSTKLPTMGSKQSMERFNITKLQRTGGTNLKAETTMSTAPPPYSDTKETHIKMGSLIPSEQEPIMNEEIPSFCERWLGFGFRLRSRNRSIEESGYLTTAIKNFRENGVDQDSAFSIWWDMLMSVFYIAIIWIVPFIVTFEVERYRLMCSVLSLVVYTSDITIQFYTFRPEKLAKDFSQILKQSTLRDSQQHYLQSWRPFWDLVGVFPLDLIPFAGSEYCLLLRLLRTVKLVDIMIRSPIYNNIGSNLGEALGLGPSFSGMFALAFGLLAFLHVQACTISLFSRLANYVSLEIPKNSSHIEHYSYSLMYAVGNVFYVNYKPPTVGEQWSVMGLSVGSGVLVSIMVGTISSIAMGIDIPARLFRQKMDEVNDYMNWKNLPPITRHKVRRYYEIKYRGKFFEEATLLNEMNESLRAEIAIHNCRELITKVPFLRRNEGDGRDDIFLGKTASALVACYYVAGDIIINQGE
ncbi:hypothetical protein HDV05_007316, partial [Chytridiales sp. JEL 0842]